MNASTTDTGSEMHLAVIVGSTREGRFADTIVGWMMPELRRLHRGSIDLIDLKTAGIPCGCGGARAQHPADAPGFDRRIALADGFIFVLPEYNHSFPGVLKTAIDSAWNEWRAKPAGFVSYGGQSGGIRAVEQLRLVLAELSVVGVRRTVAFPNASTRFDARGVPYDVEGTARALGRMYRELEWWARTLKDARAHNDDVESL